MDSLEKNIKQHRNKFETKFLNKQKVWDKIEQQIVPVKTISIWKNAWIKFSAAALLSGILILTTLHFKSQKETNAICSINGVSKEFCMQVNNYEYNIQQKLNNISSTTISIPKEVEDEIILDSPMKVILLNELKKNPNNPKIKDAILKYYHAKLELIQRIEEILKKQNKSIYNETDNSNYI